MNAVERYQKYLKRRDSLIPCDEISLVTFICCYTIMERSTNLNVSEVKLSKTNESLITHES